MADVPITIVSGDYDRIQAIKSGAVAVEGCDVTYLNLSPGETFFRLFNYQEFDVSEMSFSTYMLARSKGDWPYRAVPVFLSRVFPHCSIYIRSDRGIERPEHLHGRIVGVPSYHFTRGLAVRGMLHDEFGIGFPQGPQTYKGCKGVTRCVGTSPTENLPTPLAVTVLRRRVAAAALSMWLRARMGYRIIRGHCLATNLIDAVHGRGSQTGIVHLGTNVVA